MGKMGLDAGIRLSIPVGERSHRGQGRFATRKRVKKKIKKNAPIPLTMKQG